MPSSAIAFAKANENRFLEELKDLLRIPSVSTLPEHKPDIEKSAAFIAGELKRIGIEHVEIIATEGIPWFMATGCTPPASPPCCFMLTTTCSPPSH